MVARPTPGPGSSPAGESKSIGIPSFTYMPYTSMGSI